MLWNQNPRGAICSGIQTEIPLRGVNIRRNVSRIKRLKALSPSEIVPESEGQYAPDYPNVQKTKNDSLKISGNLTIREITNNIEFFALQKDGKFKTSFTFNRLDWNIAYEGSWADKTLVDKDVELRIEIVID